MLFIKQGYWQCGFVNTYALPTELPAKTGEDSNLRPHAILTKNSTSTAPANAKYFANMKLLQMISKNLQGLLVSRCKANT